MNASELMAMFRKSNPDFLKQHSVVNVKMSNEKLRIFTSEGEEYIYNGATGTICKSQRRSVSDKIKISEEREWLELFSKRLRALMSKREMTITQLSQLSGVSESTIRCYLYSQVSPSAYKVLCIAKALSVSPMALTSFL